MKDLFKKSLIKCYQVFIVPGILRLYLECNLHSKHPKDRMKILMVQHGEECVISIIVWSAKFWLFTLALGIVCQIIFN